MNWLGGGTPNSAWGCFHYDERKLSLSIGIRPRLRLSNESSFHRIVMNVLYDLLKLSHPQTELGVVPYSTLRVILSIKTKRRRTSRRLPLLLAVTAISGEAGETKR